MHSNATDPLVTSSDNAAAAPRMRSQATTRFTLDLLDMCRYLIVRRTDPMLPPTWSSMSTWGPSRSSRNPAQPVAVFPPSNTCRPRRRTRAGRRYVRRAPVACGRRGVRGRMTDRLVLGTRVAATPHEPNGRDARALQRIRGGCAPDAAALQLLVVGMPQAVGHATRSARRSRQPSPAPTPGRASARGRRVPRPASRPPTGRPHRDTAACARTARK